jgi:hypothetical protein
MFYISNDIKNIQFGVEMRENLKVFNDRVPLVVYLSCNPTQLQPNNNSNDCNLVAQASLSFIRPRLELIIYLA